MNSKQVVLITGSSTGFGRLFVDSLARKGHTVFATMPDPGGRNAKNASKIRAPGPLTAEPLDLPPTPDEGFVSADAEALKVRPRQLMILVPPSLGPSGSSRRREPSRVEP